MAHKNFPKSAIPRAAKCLRRGDLIFLTMKDGSKYLCKFMRHWGAFKRPTAQNFLMTWSNSFKEKRAKYVLLCFRIRYLGIDIGNEVLLGSGWNFEPQDIFIGSIKYCERVPRKNLPLYMNMKYLSPLFEQELKTS